MRLPILFFFTLSFLISCESSNNETRNDSDSLVGPWRLIADQQIDNAGKIIVQDTAVSGLIIYAPEGKMSVQWLCFGTRNSMMTDTIMNQDGVTYGTGFGKNTWTTEQARTIIDTYDAYFGDYTIDWDNQVVTHVVTGNLRPEKKGKMYHRKFQLKGDTLLLRDINPEMHWQAAWVRISK